MKNYTHKKDPSHKQSDNASLHYCEQCEQEGSNKNGL